MDSAALFSASRRRAIAWSPGRRFGVSFALDAYDWNSTSQGRPESPVTVASSDSATTRRESPTCDRLVTWSAVRGVLARWMLAMWNSTSQGHPESPVSVPVVIQRRRSGWPRIGMAKRSSS